MKDISQWNFDGSSTKQSDTGNSDLVLNPVHMVKAPSKLGVDYLVMCEVLNKDGSPHWSNTRKSLEEKYRELEGEEFRVGFEQEYFLRSVCHKSILGWEEGTPRPQGDYYCAVGPQNVSGRSVALEHLSMCVEAGININGINAEVALGQWEFQIGGTDIDALKACDELWISRSILSRVGEMMFCEIDLDPKPVDGDWNGSGMHTNFSTRRMREDDGLFYIEEFAHRMGRTEMINLAKNNYGSGLERRLTGDHETEDINSFSVGKMSRGSSIRIPVSVVNDEKGYLEDRRPNSNADPYRVLGVLVSNLLNN